MRRICVLLSVAAVVLMSAGPAYSYTVCASNGGPSHAAWHWRYVSNGNNGYSYTDISTWNSDCCSYDGSRFDSGGIATWTQWKQGGGYMSFDNGTSSPWRKTGLYNNNSPQWTWVEQIDDNGFC